MRAYGINGQHPFMDEWETAAPSALVHVPGPGGDCRAVFRSSRRKRAIRRIWKRRARAEARRLIRSGNGE